MVFISNKHKFIFIHIPKTCGQTIKKTLQNNDYNITCKKRQYLYSKKCQDNTGKFKNPYHHTIDDLINNNISLDGYFVFTFVRNPYDRFYSLYLHLKQDLIGSTKTILLFNILALMILYSIKDKYISNILGLLLIIFNLLIIKKTDYIVLLYNILTNDFNTFIKYNYDKIVDKYYHHIKPMHLYIDKNNVDFIGREETFEKDFYYILNKFNIQTDIQNTNIKNMKKDNTKLKYIQHFNTDTINLVNNIYKKDFQMFNYPMILHKAT